MISDHIQTFFKTTKNPAVMPFGIRDGGRNFNYVDFGDKERIFTGNECALYKQMNDSFVLELKTDNKYPDDYVIPELKLTNQELITWEDYWIDAKTKTLVNPKISKLNLQKNKLIHANLNLPRPDLTSLNLEGNLNLRAVIITESPALEILNISNCQYLSVINLGLNRNLKAVLAKNCRLTPAAQEKLLRDFSPTITASSNVGFSMFRKKAETLLDLRATEVDWGNRRIASKIRLLLCNNWMVLWDNPPPTSIIPPQMYGFFTNSLEDSLIKDYYSN